MKSLLFLISLIFLTGIAAAQRFDRDESVDKLIEWLSIPNDANYPGQIGQNLNWLESEFSDKEFNVSRLQTKGLPLFFAERVISDELPTVLFYMHFDGQPVDSSKWDQISPYKAVIKKQVNDEWVELEKGEKINENYRIFARSASDDKGPIMMFLEALENLGPSQAYNIKVILDSQEEQGSPHLGEAVKEYKDVLKADYLIALDGPMHDSLRPTLLYGVRGIIRVSMEIYGPAKAQHSGHFGNYAPNPVFLTAKLLSSMKDYDGRALIEGFYDNIDIDQQTQKTLERVPDNEVIIKERAGFKLSEKVGSSYQESIQYPSLNVSGIRSGWVGNQSRTIVPSSCIVEMDIRTVPESEGSDLISKLENHIKEEGFTIVNQKLGADEIINYDRPIYFNARELMFPFRTAIDSEIGRWLRKSINETELVQLRISGGSVPISFFINELNIPTVLVPLVNPDNNQHSPNENLILRNYFEGINTIKKILETPLK